MHAMPDPDAGRHPNPPPQAGEGKGGGRRGCRAGARSWIPAFAGMTEAKSRRIWLVGLSLYAIAAAADIAVHLNQDRQAGREWLNTANLAVAFSAGLFWPVDLVAQQLLSR